MKGIINLKAWNSTKCIYVDTGQVSEYAKWVEGLDFVEVSDAELDNASYESAEKQNLQGKKEAAIKGYESYIRDFPNGLHTINANFKLAQLYFAKGDKDRALPAYTFVANSGASEYSEQSLTRVCEIYVGNKNYTSRSSSCPYPEAHPEAHGGHY